MASTEVELEAIGTLEHDRQVRPPVSLGAAGSATLTLTTETPDADTTTNTIVPTTTIAGDEPGAPSKIQAAALIATLTCICFLSDFNSGILTVALPAIADDLGLPAHLLLWPASVFALGLCCALLPLGAVADVVGNRPVFVLGSLLLTLWTVAIALARSGGELIAFRTLQGMSTAFCIPTAVSIITHTFPSGKVRNVAFAVFGGGAPLGFATGLVLGGVFVRISGWRTAYYLAAGASAATCVLAWFTIPSAATTRPARNTADRLMHEIDWVGVASATGFLSILSYLFAEIAYSGTVMRHAYNIVLLVVAVALIPSFIFWVGRQETLGRPALVPNSVWRNGEFTTTCLTVFLVWAWFNSFGYWTTLFFQIVQGLDALQAALRFLPMVVCGVLTNVAAGLVMDKIPAGTLVLISGLLSAVSPLLFALQNPDWTYWAAGFPAMCLSVLSTDLLFNISNLIITSSFPRKDQALAGAIFQTVAQLGNSIGVAVTAIIASAVTQADLSGKSGVEASDYATLEGYRGAFWACFAAAALSAVISTAGLRKTGKVGMKKDL